MLNRVHLPLRSKIKNNAHIRLMYIISNVKWIFFSLHHFSTSSFFFSVCFVLCECSTVIVIMLEISLAHGELFNRSFLSFFFLFFVGGTDYDLCSKSELMMLWSYFIFSHSFSLSHSGWQLFSSSFALSHDRLLFFLYPLAVDSLLFLVPSSSWWVGECVPEYEFVCVFVCVV